MLVALVMAGVALRAGLEMRRRRRRKQPTKRGLLAAHLRMARPAVLLMLVGGVGGPLSAVWLRDWSPFGTLHGWLGVLTAALLASAGWLGLRMQQGRLRRDEGASLHGMLGTLGLLVAAVAAVAGMVLLP
jgi:hypothetical protein